VEDGETVEQALVREVAEEACARVRRCRYLAAQHVADPLNPLGVPSNYQTRWWARVELDPWRPRLAR
jgi:ADP-ribose pyrophosphatase YjhB (NUDIX family)